MDSDEVDRQVWFWRGSLADYSAESSLSEVVGRLIDPKFPCRRMLTRPCPASYESVCGSRPCARFESDDPAPWR